MAGQCTFWISTFRFFQKIHPGIIQRFQRFRLCIFHMAFYVYKTCIFFDFFSNIGSIQLQNGRQTIDHILFVLPFGQICSGISLTHNFRVDIHRISSYTDCQSIAITIVDCTAIRFDINFTQTRIQCTVFQFRRMNQLLVSQFRRNTQNYQQKDKHYKFHSFFHAARHTTIILNHYSVADR